MGWLPSTPIYTTLLFNSRNDGDSIELITNALLDKSHTLVIIQTKDGYKFGGYATQKWKKSEKIYDKNAFVFSLDKGKKYKIIKPENSYYLSSGGDLEPMEMQLLLFKIVLQEMKFCK